MDLHSRHRLVNQKPYLFWWSFPWLREELEEGAFCEQTGGAPSKLLFCARQKLGRSERVALLRPENLKRPSSYPDWLASGWPQQEKRKRRSQPLADRRSSRAKDFQSAKGIVPNAWIWDFECESLERITIIHDLGAIGTEGQLPVTLNLYVTLTYMMAILQSATLLWQSSPDSDWPTSLFWVPKAKNKVPF